MKISIEFTKTEMESLKKTASKVGTEVCKLCDEDFTEENVNDFFNEVTTVDTEANFGSIKSNTDETTGNTTFNFSFNTPFINSLLEIGGIFYGGIAKTIVSVAEPFRNFYEKYLS